VGKLRAALLPLSRKRALSTAGLADDSEVHAVSEPTGQRRSPDIIAPPRLREPRLATCPRGPGRRIGRRLRIAGLRHTLLVSYGVAK
jgi:hypothetical protein